MSSFVEEKINSTNVIIDADFLNGLFHFFDIRQRVNFHRGAALVRGLKLLNELLKISLDGLPVVRLISAKEPSAKC
ncbi:hypothetical protein D3C86_2133780 [compost metagenome]